MLIVSLTGGIAAGKSVVASLFHEFGCYIHHADETAHYLMEPEKPAWKAIVSHYGKSIINPDKTINRSMLGSIVFSSEKERLFLNTLLHPLVFKKKKEIIKKLEKENRYSIFISEAALTIEAGFADFFDKIVLVYCKKAIQIQRLKDRDHISHREALNKIKSQMSSDEKLEYADYTIDTSNSVQSTVEQTERVYRNLVIDRSLKKKEERGKEKSSSY